MITNYFILKGQKSKFVIKVGPTNIFCSFKNSTSYQNFLRFMDLRVNYEDPWEMRMGM
jgi:hypothetical protein